MHINKVVGSLFSVLVTMGVVPIIRCPSGNAAESVAAKLDAKLRDHLANTRNNLFQESLSGTLSRPVLIIRTGMRIYREKGSKMKKNYDLDITDFFWAKNAGNPFPEVAGEYMY
ncbi:Sec1-like protein [Chytridium lagenaria]|nr:Sec1-like protein [Chytridium lagenaria]